MNKQMINGMVDEYMDDLKEIIKEDLETFTPEQLAVVESALVKGNTVHDLIQGIVDALK